MANEESTECFYGRVKIIHHDQGMTARIGEVVRRALADAGIAGADVATEWVLYENNQTTVDQVLANGRWACVRLGSPFVKRVPAVPASRSTII